MFTAIDPRELGNAVHMIGDQWTLITAEKKDGSINTMTASWGFMGVLWNKPACVIFIRPSRHTLGFVEEADRLTLTFFDDQYRDALKLCGTKSGKELDKFAAAGITAADFNGVPFIGEAELVLVCRKLYADDLKKQCFLAPELLCNYKEDDFHRVYVVEIEAVLKRNEE